MSAYRAPEKTETRELVYDNGETSVDRLDWLRTASVALTVGAGVSLLALAAGLHQLAVGSAGLAVAWALFKRRRSDAAGPVLQVRAGELRILSSDRRRVETTIRLAELCDVVLDTKTIRKVEPGGGTIAALRHLETTVGPEIDTSRIVLVVAEPRPAILLSESYGAHMDGVEQIAKIRSFLRANGWVPEDERADPD